MQQPRSSSEVAEELQLRATDTLGTPTGGHGSSRMDLGRLRGSWMDVSWLGSPGWTLVHTPGLCGDVLDGSRSSWMDLGALGGHLAGPCVGSRSPWGHPGWSWDLWGHLAAPGDVLWCPGPCEDVGTSRVGLRGQGQGFMGTLGPLGDILVAQGPEGISWEGNKARLRTGTHPGWPRDLWGQGWWPKALLRSPGPREDVGTSWMAQEPLGTSWVAQNSWWWPRATWGHPGCP